MNQDDRYELSGCIAILRVVENTLEEFNGITDYCDDDDMITYNRIIYDLAHLTDHLCDLLMEVSKDES